MKAVADLITEQLRALGTPERATQEKRYLKSDLEFLGASYWQTGAQIKAWAREHRGVSHAELVALVEELWSTPIFERRAAATMLLERYVKLLSPADLPLIERLLRESRTWALVDGLAAHAVGAIRVAAPAEVAPVLDRWAADPDFWIRRSSLLAELLPLRAGADLAPFLRRAEAMLDEKEFFIRKSIGWVLREVGKRRPSEVVAWLAPRTHRASGVTMREAIRYLPADDGEWLMAAYRGKRPAA